MLVAVLASALCGCSAEEAASRRHPDLVVLVIDALRPDHVGAYGYRRPTTPTLDRLARDGALFDRATSAANFTTASVPSIFTGFWPSVHGVFEEGDRLDDGFVTLAERLRESGYATAAFAPNPSLGRRFNFDQGFDLYDDKALRNDETIPWKHFETAERIQAGALRFLDGIAPDRPAFLYLHYRDVHGPYVPPPPFDRMFVDAEVNAAPDLARAERDAIPAYLRLADAPQSLAYYLSQYDGGIRYTDESIASLLRALDERGRLRTSWILVTADHGESFLEHGVWNHGNDLYQEEIHVPLILVAPDGRGAGRRLEALVSGVDLLPTLLEAAAVPMADAVQGQSLIPLLDGARGERVAVFAEGRERIAVREERLKLLRTDVSGQWRLFALDDDPREVDDLAPSSPDSVRRLQASARRFLAESKRLGAGRRPTQVEIDEGIARELRALGYLR